MCWCEAVNMFLIASTCVNVFDLQPWIFGRSAPKITGGLSRALHLGWCPTGRKSNSGKRRHSSDVRYRDLDKIIAVRRDLGCMSRRRYVKTWFFTLQREMLNIVESNHWCDSQSMLCSCWLLARCKSMLKGLDDLGHRTCRHGWDRCSYDAREICTHDAYYQKIREREREDCGSDIGIICVIVPDPLGHDKYPGR